MTEIKTGTWMRTVTLLFALVNQVLAVLGKEVLPFGEEEVYQVVTLITTLVTSFAAWWKNNSFTKAAILADAVMKKEKEATKGATGEQTASV